MLIKAKSLVRLQRHFSRTLKQNEGTDINLTSHPNVVSPIGTMPLMLCPMIQMTTHCCHHSKNRIIAISVYSMPINVQERKHQFTRINFSFIGQNGTFETLPFPKEGLRREVIQQYYRISPALYQLFTQGQTNRRPPIAYPYLGLLKETLHSVLTGKTQKCRKTLILKSQSLKTLQ